MAIVTTNVFTTYQLTRDEEISGRILNQQQKQVLQNLQASVATDKLNLVFDPANVADYQMQVAYKQGQLDLIAYMLAESDEAETAYVTQPQQDQE